MAHEVPQAHSYGLGGIATSNNPDITQATITATNAFEYKFNESQSRVRIQSYLHASSTTFIKVKINGPATATDWDAVLTGAISADAYEPPEGIGKITSVGIYAIGATLTYQTTFTIKGWR